MLFFNSPEIASFRHEQSKCLFSSFLKRRRTPLRFVRGNDGARAMRLLRRPPGGLLAMTEIRNDSRILIATRNPGKFHEICAVLAGLPFEFLFLGDFPDAFDFEEEGATFEENAVSKARFFADKTGMPTIGEDSGIVVSALSGEMGVKTRRWGKGETATDQEWLEFFLCRMREFPNQREAEFICSAAIFLAGSVFLFTGSCRGEITNDIEAPIIQGLPLSSVFRPIGSDRVYAALTSEEKGRISHRGIALFKMKAFLRSMKKTSH